MEFSTIDKVHSAPIAEAIVGSLSPSRASDFKTCPLLYRFRSIDRLPEIPSKAAVRGTVVHAVLERLFDLPPAERTLPVARALVEPAWHQLVADNPALTDLFVAEPDATEPHEGTITQWLESAGELVASYFALEDPARLEPIAREELVEVVIDGLRLRGYVDRLDESSSGELRVVDYKTGAIPREAFEAKALFQMKFYALVLWRLRGVVPAQLKLIYLADRDTLTYAPSADELLRFERTLHAIWTAIGRATALEEFRPSPSRLCGWCSYQALCPAFGGTPPPFPGPPRAATVTEYAASGGTASVLDV
ncbi:MAG: RecB family exonuclease [Actinomycetota bacterium]